MTTTEALERMTAVVRRQHKALSTERIYCLWLRQYCQFAKGLPPGLASERKVEAFLTHLARSRNVSASTQNQAFNALLFFYKAVIGQPLQSVDALRASRPQQIRHAPSLLETRRLLDAVRDVGGYPTGLIVKMLYGCGLRVSEPLNLRIKDVGLAESKLFILGAKGGKDRVVRLPCSLSVGIEEQMAYARAIWQRDQVLKTPVPLPNQLAVKYPEYQFAWPWAWLFPGHHPCREPRSGRMVRWHLLAGNVQRAVKVARRQLGIAVTPHNLRHAYATHCLDRGVRLKALQEAMGHKSSETTMGYCHADALSVASPLDALASLP